MEDGVAAKASGRKVLTHVPTGLAEYDEVFGGLELSVMTLLVGHTGDGKSALMKQFLKAAAVAGVAGLGYFVEDPRARTADRFLADETQLNAADLSRLLVTQAEVADIRAAVKAADWTDRVALHFGPVTPERI